MKFCPNCGHKISNQVQFCPYCGANVASISFNNNEASQSPQYQPVSKPRNNKRYRHRGIIFILFVIVILLLFGGYKAKQYYTQARFLSWQIPHYTWMIGDQNHQSEYNYIIFGKHQVLGGADPDDNSDMEALNSLSTHGHKDSKVRKILLKIWKSSEGRKVQSKARYSINGDEIKFGSGMKFRNIKKHGHKYTFQVIDSNGKRYAGYLKKYKKISPIK